MPYKVFACLTDIKAQWYKYFDQVLDDADDSHAYKLNSLADRICDEARDDDIILFIDGDAFPIDRLDNKLEEWLSQIPVVAIRRIENLGEKHPHPSFCAMRVDTWKQLGASWNKGYTWINDLNVEETDVGAELLRALDQQDMEWLPIQRSNELNVLPVWYGIYGDRVYHHGAGFRDRGCRKIWHDEGLYAVYRRWDARLLNAVFRGPMQKKVRESFLHPEGRMKHRIRNRLVKIDEDVEEKLREDPDSFFRMLRYGA